MTHIIQAVSNELPLHDLVMFVAGSITSCNDWQTDFCKSIKGDVTIFNPNRENFPVGNTEARVEQITWEYERLAVSNVIVFWIAKESLTPTIPYELGKWANSSDIPVFIGCDPNYPGKQDVIVQTRLARPEVKVVFSLEQLAEKVNQYVARVTGFAKLQEYIENYGIQKTFKDFTVRDLPKDDPILLGAFETAKSTVLMFESLLRERVARNN